MPTPTTIANKYMVTFFLTLIGSATSAFATADLVNRVNGGANIVYADFSIPGPVVPLELVRTYNSITAVNESNGWNGAMGWGWTTPFETSLTITPERHVLLRDGQTGNTLQFRTEREDPKIQYEFMENMKRAFYEKQKGRPLSADELSQLNLPERIRARLNSDPQFREELASRYGVKGVVPRGEILTSTEYGYQTLQFKDGQWFRDKDGVQQIFDSEGRIIRQKDKNGFYFNYKYSKSQKLHLSEIAAEDNTITLRFRWKGDHVIEVVDNKNRKASYVYDTKGNLIKATDSSGQTYNYQYEYKKYPHLLTKVEYVSESSGNDKVYRELKYDENGLVVFHKEKDGSTSEYTYGKSPNDPENNFWTKMVKRSGGNTFEEHSEYFTKARPDGSKYLYKQEVKTKGATTVTLFTTFGKPSQITRNGETTIYKYYDNGLLAQRKSPKEDVRLEYDMRWKKLSKVTQNDLVSNYTYDNKGNLTTASNSRNDRVSLKYDKLGRIAEMIDRKGQQITFKYGDQGKPVLISDKTVGTIRIEYDSIGKIKKTEAAANKARGRKPTQAKLNEVVHRVMQGFQNLLDIMRPAGLNLLSS